MTESHLKHAKALGYYEAAQNPSVDNIQTPDDEYRYDVDAMIAFRKGWEEQRAAMAGGIHEDILGRISDRLHDLEEGMLWKGDLDKLYSRMADIMDLIRNCAAIPKGEFANLSPYYGGLGGANGYVSGGTLGSQNGGGGASGGDGAGGAHHGTAKGGAAIVMKLDESFDEAMLRAVEGQMTFAPHPLPKPKQWKPPYVRKPGDGAFFNELHISEEGGVHVLHAWDGKKWVELIRSTSLTVINACNFVPTVESVTQLFSTSPAIGTMGSAVNLICDAFKKWEASQPPLPAPPVGMVRAFSPKVVTFDMNVGGQLVKVSGIALKR